MRLTRLFIDGELIAGATLPLPRGAAQHIARVLRLQPGDELRLFNGHGGEYAARVGLIARDGVSVLVGARHAIDRESPLQITLLQGIARGEKMDLILQKSTELGVTAIRPLMSLRSNVRIKGDNEESKHEHWLGVIRSACEQSGRNRLPQLLPALRVADAIVSLDQPLRLLLEPDASATGLRELAMPVASTAPGGIVLMVGPEGGFDATEIEAAHAAGFRSCRMGPRVLRTETAALAALAALQALAGDLA
ncbi:MAG: 16S rRNA (uracil(1498)-N(3))-methyltransferase [Pseudomonadota bacterium]